MYLRDVLYLDPRWQLPILSNSKPDGPLSTTRVATSQCIANRASGKLSLYVGQPPRLLSDRWALYAVLISYISEGWTGVDIRGCRGVGAHGHAVGSGQGAASQR
jgi:hypothetical protein